MSERLRRWLLVVWCVVLGHVFAFYEARVHPTWVSLLLLAAVAAVFGWLAVLLNRANRR